MDQPHDVVLVTKAETKKSSPESGLSRLVGAYNEKLFLAEHHMEKGWVGLAHSHPHEQLAYVISGHLKVTCAGRTFDVRAGDSFIVRGDVEHQATALEPTHVIDVFTPCRNDYVEK
ncbi:MAG TPA: cupin domain-containing protein [Candidatus Angelobacter sp.]|nr:cupin domain-containing protein [Candidatus Angelobacter sp.]